MYIPSEWEQEVRITIWSSRTNSIQNQNPFDSFLFSKIVGL